MSCVVDVISRHNATLTANAETECKHEELTGLGQIHFRKPNLQSTSMRTWKVFFLGSLFPMDWSVYLFSICYISLCLVMRRCSLIYGLCKAGLWLLQVLNRVIVSGWELVQIFSFAKYYLPVSTSASLLRAWAYKQTDTSHSSPHKCRQQTLDQKSGENVLHLFIRVCKWLVMTSKI